MHTRRDSKPATSIGATAHWADRFLSVEKGIDEISVTGGHQCLSRSLNRRPDTLERCLCSFRANKLESLPLRGQPTGLTFLSFAPAAVCSNPQSITPTENPPARGGIFRW